MLKHKLCLILLLLVVCVTAKDLRKLKRLGTLTTQGKDREKNHNVQHLKVKEGKCFGSEDDANNPLILEPKIKSDTTPMNSKSSNLADKLSKWEAETGTPVFPNIDRGAVIEGVKKRLDNPARVNQGSTPCCGPAAIIFWLIVRRPFTYVNVAHDLYETGTYTDPDTAFTITITDKHKNAPATILADHQLDAADWVVIVGLRVNDNILLNFDQFGDLWGAATPPQMVAWTKNLLGFANADSKENLIGDQTEALQAAEQAVNGDSAGGVASFLVDLKAVKGNPLIPIPNHWIAYIGGLQITSDTVSFRAFTWGQLCDITSARSDWQGNAFGMVYGFAPGAAGPQGGSGT